MTHEDMIQIVEGLHSYVPTLTSTEHVDVPGTPDSLQVTLDRFHYTLFGGDMLTAARARESKSIRSNSVRGKDRLEGVIPVVEDWHTKLCLLEVCMYKYAFCCEWPLVQ